MGVRVPGAFGSDSPAVLIVSSIPVHSALGSSRLVGEWSCASIDAFVAQVREYLTARLCSGDKGEDLHLGAACGASERDVKDALQELLPLSSPMGGWKFLIDNARLRSGYPRPSGPS